MCLQVSMTTLTERSNAQHTEKKLFVIQYDILRQFFGVEMEIRHNFRKQIASKMLMIVINLLTNNC